MGVGGPREGTREGVGREEFEKVVTIGARGGREGVEEREILAGEA